MAAGAAVVATLPPHWRARGAPWVLGYGKNVELVAVACAFGAGAASRWLVTARSGRWAVGAVATIGFAVAVRHADLPALYASWPQLGLVVALVAALRIFWPRTAASAPERGDDLPAWLTVPLLGALAAAAFALGVESLEIDVFHHGEVLASAVDLLQGGRPFKTFIWPHGLHDTGLAALWILLTGKIGTSPVALARATCRALGIVSTYCLGRRLLGSRAEALVACVPLALAPGLLADDARREAEAFAIHQLGVLVCVAVGFTILTARRAHAELAAGIAFGLAYLFRIETGLFGAAAAVAVLGARALDHRELGPARAVRASAARVAELVLGMVLAVAGVSLAAGWPGREWFAYTLGELPRYHRDAVGLPFPWPVRGWSFPAAAPPGVSVAWLVFVLLLLVQAVRTTIVRRDGAPAVKARADQLLFLAVFVALAVRSSLERSDAPHVLQWSALPLVAAVMLAVALVRDRFAWPRRHAAIAALVLLGLAHYGALEVTVPALRGPRESIAAAASHRRQLAEHLAPNLPVGACADTTFTPTEAALNRGFIDDTCTMEALLRSHDVTELVIEHSAPWYYVRFGMRPPTRFFAFARAYTPAREEELVGDLRARHPQALLRVHGYRALDRFDVPDALRGPVVDAWIGERRRGVVATPTPLGELFFWSEPIICAADRAPASEPDVGLTAPAGRGDLDGPEWASLPSAIARAAALGRADRAAVCADGAEGRRAAQNRRSEGGS